MRRSLAAILAAVALSSACVYGVSEWKLRRDYDAPLLPVKRPDAPDLAAGERLAKMVGCWAGCHGAEGEGGVDSIDGIHRTTAPTLSHVLPAYSDEELARLVRYGVKRTGKSAVGMNSYALWALGDEDLANIIAHLRSQPARPPVRRVQEITLRGRLALVTGAWGVSAAMVDRSWPRWGELPRSTAFERGRYLASIVCSECHGLDFRGNRLEGGPSLSVVAAFDPRQFRQLMRTGESIGGRKIPRMSSWLPDVGFTDQEIADIREFLVVQVGQPSSPRPPQASRVGP